MARKKMKPKAQTKKKKVSDHRPTFTLSFTVSGDFRQDIEIVKPGLTKAVLIAGLNDGTYTTTIHEERQIIGLEDEVVAVVTHNDTLLDYSDFRDAEASKLAALVRHLRLADDDLDDAVHTLSQELHLAELNSATTTAMQEQVIAAAEDAASEINNAGIEAQVTFLLEHNSEATVEQIIRDSGGQQ